MLSFKRKYRNKINSAKRNRSRHTMRYVFIFLFLVLLILIGLYSFQKRSNLKTPFKPASTPQKSVPMNPSDVESASPGIRKPGARKPVRAKVAIIIDDFGYNLEKAKEFVEFEYPVTLSILPRVRYSEETAELAIAHNKSVMLHLPMEPTGPIYPGPGAVRTDTEPDTIRRIIQADLETVPGAVGANNHEGSKATADVATMEVVLDYLKSKGLFFIDSGTAYNSVSLRTGKKIDARVDRRDVFLDNVDDLDYIKEQIRQLIELAKKQGYAIGIGHPKTYTLKAIKEMMPVFQEEDIDLVFVKDLL